MDPEVRAKGPGKCPRCGMTLVPGIPQPVEYPMEFKAEPRQIPAGRDVTFDFRVLDPKDQPAGQEIRDRAREAVPPFRGEPGSGILRA